MLLALFEADHELTAIFQVAAIVIWVLAAFTGAAFSRRVGGQLGLVALGLAVWFFPAMWRTFDAAF